MLTDREAFKFGFLLRCAEEGLSPEETETRIKAACQQVKQAEGESWPQTLVNGAKSLGWLSLLGSGIAGAGAGYTAAKVLSPEDDTDDAKQRELAAAYQLYAEQVRRNNARRTLRPVMAPRAPRLVA